MITCSRKITFEAAHRIVGHEGSCKFLHGHRYVCTFKFTSKALDNLGRVIDFSIIKDLVGKWIKENLDHNVILWEKDKELIASIEKCTNQKVFCLPNNPTVENLTSYLLYDVCPKLFKDHIADCIEITIEETENSKSSVKI
jgi:6-pyruvoyltetrahydropterin/6-carboxytetrahydropterin synthase